MRHVSIYTEVESKGMRQQDMWMCWLIEVVTRTGKKTCQGMRKIKDATHSGAQLAALNEALSHMVEKCDIDIYLTDVFVETAFKQNWIEKWEKNNWISARGTEIKHTAEWEQLKELLSGHDVRMHFTCMHEYSNWMQTQIRMEIKKEEENV